LTENATMQGDFGEKWLAAVASGLTRIERLGGDLGARDARPSDFDTLLRTDLARLKGL